MFPIEPHPQLEAFVATHNADTDALALALEPPDQRKELGRTRHQICVLSDIEDGFWEVPSLRDLYRGDNKALAQTSHYPEEYIPFFVEIEQAIVAASSLIPIPIDAEFIDIFSTMRRRPDGKSMGYMHDVVWQAACLALGKYPYSQDECQAMMRQLTRSAKTWKTDYTSRNYVRYLQNNFGR